MAIAVACACGKRFEAEDRHAGRRMRCPGCGETLLIGGAAATGPIPGGLVPPGRRITKSGPQAKIAVSPKLIALIALVVLVPTVIFVVKQGPARAADQWRQMSPVAQDQITDVLNAAMREGLPENLPTQNLPAVHTLLLDEPRVMWSLPEKIPFQGRNTPTLTAGFSASGNPQLMNIHGTYNTKTGEVEAEIDEGGTPRKVRGRMVDGKPVLEK